MGDDVIKKDSKSRDHKEVGGDCRVEVAEFDSSAKSFLSTIDAIEALCGDSAQKIADASEIALFSSNVTFLREWKGFCYDTKVADFICQTGDGQTKKFAKSIHLPQFSSAAVPKMEEVPDKKLCSYSNDFILHAGGLVWALDWCPQTREKSNCQINTEYLAVAAHPPGATYHKIGTVLKGRGMVQIWCILTLNDKDDASSREKTKKATGAEVNRPRGRPRKKPLTGEGITTSRPRKRPATPSSEDELDSDSIVGRSENEVLPITAGLNGSTDLSLKRPRGRPRKADTTGGNDITGFSSKRSKGRPTKHPLPATTNFSETQDINSCDAQEILSTIRFVEPTCDGSTGCNNVTGLSSGRPIKHKDPLPNIMNVTEEPGKPSCNQDQILQNNAYIEHLHRKHSLLNVSESSGKEYSIFAKNQMPGTGANIVSSHVDAGNSALVSQVSAAENYKEKAIVPSQQIEITPCSKEIIVYTRKRRHKKASVPNMSDVTFSGKEDLPPCREIDGNGHVVPPSVVSPSNELAIPTIDSDDELSLHLCKRIPRKKKVPSLDKFSPAVDVASGPHAPALLTSSELTLDTNAIAGGAETSEVKMASHFIPKDIALPRVVLCLAHNGKVAWDVKWKPSTLNVYRKHHMGYLAVLLGDGSLEVWDVPLLSTVKTLYTANCNESSREDPRFIKLEPVFRCSKVKFGDRLSFPMTVEWSPFPCDLILAGCHDGTVAIWKFSTDFSSQDTKPLMCFSADSVPIRALAWAPTESDAENNNLFVTAGHEGIKFWDMRDPYHPLLELNPVQRAVLSIDWVKDPRCIIMSLDDGTLRILNLRDAAHYDPVTTEPFVRRKSQGLQILACSSSAIWCIQVSQYTGFASYCTADGLAVHFQLTSKSVDKGHRYRMPHFLCGSLIEKDQRLNVNSVLTPSPLANVPFLLKKTSTDCRDDVQTNHYDTLEMDQATESFNATTDMKLASMFGTREKQSDDGQKCSTTKNEELKPEGNVDRAQEDEPFPPKNVAMHRVRWNMNKGSSRWLCYGGAAGIIRCQQIS